MYQALYRKWRPKAFSDVVGQEHITTTLQKQVAEGRLSHAYLFTGTRGTGKTTCAKILAKAVNCEHPVNGDPCNCCPSCLGIESGGFMDVMELDAASNNGVDHVRALRDEAIYSPAQVKKRVYIVDEVHMLSVAAFNALLKILEEPPEHLMFILATTELHKVPATILSRCQRFSFRRILPRDITARLAYVAKEEGIDLRPDGAEMLARLADGALRDALSLLDQCAASGGTVDSAAVLDTLGLAGSIQTVQLMEFILRRDAKAALLLLHRLYAGGKDVGAVLGELSTLARDLLITRTAPEGGTALLTGGFDPESVKGLLQLGSSARLISISTVLQSTLADMGMSANRRTDAELCILKLCDETLGGDLTALNARIARLEEMVNARSFAAAPAAPTQTVSAPAAPAPAASAPVPEAEEALPWDDVPPEDGPPPYGEPTEPAAPAVPPAPKKTVSAPAPAAPKAASGDAEALWNSLTENYKSRLAVMQRVFIGKVRGVLDGDVMRVHCPSEIEKNMLSAPDAEAVLHDVTSAAAGRDIAIRFVVGMPEGGAQRDPMEELLRLGSKFDNFKVN